jgi:osmotically-inducible protein OsmY
VGAEVGLIRPVREISDEQTDCQNFLVKARRKQYFPLRRSILSQNGHQPRPHPWRALILQPGAAEEYNDMRTPQLLSGALGAVMILAAGCSRSDATRNAREAATEVRGVAAEAGDRLADGWLTTKVQAQYFADRDVKARYINVSARDGVVTLKGYVDSEPTRQMVLQIARNTDGVVRVNDELLVGAAPGKETFETTTAAGSTPTTGNEYDASIAAGSAAAARSDAELTSMVQARFFLDPVLKTRVIDVQTRGGVVTLRGQVADEMERAQALVLARQTSGVSRVEDLLLTVPNPDPAWKP